MIEIDAALIASATKVTAAAFFGVGPVDFVFGEPWNSTADITIGTDSTFVATAILRGMDDFEIQMEAFEQIPPLVLVPYSGNWVASMDGVIVDSDRNLPVLMNRFYEKYGDAPVYMTQVGEPPLRIRTPFLR